MPEDARTDADQAFLADAAQVNIIHLVYLKKVYETHSRGYEF